MVDATQITKQRLHTGSLTSKSSLIQDLRSLLDCKEMSSRIKTGVTISKDIGEVESHLTFADRLANR